MTSTRAPSTDSWVVQAWSQGVDTTPDHGSAGAATCDQSAVQAAFVLRTIGQLLQCPDAIDACRLLANRLQQFLGCRQVAVALSDRRRRRCRLRSLSGVVRFDAHSARASAVQDAVDEAVVRGCPTLWPPAEDSQRHATRAHQKLVALMGAECVVSLPLCDRDEAVVGVVQLIDEPSPEAVGFLQQHAAVLASVLGRLQRHQVGRVGRLLRQLSPHGANWRGRAILLGAFLALGCLALPLPYRVDCSCQIQPVTRRFVVAPYDGTLEKCLVAPGDMVQRGQVLARMDQREIRWELAELKAAQARAEKERDAAMAGHKTSGAQLAALEMQRLQLQMQLLEHRLENLAVRSPIDGVVVSGDLEKTEGAPLTIGQALFEIAPLERMVCEVNVREKDILQVQVGMPATVTLDALADTTISGAILRIHPRAELRNDESIFVADLELDNPQGQLRPGMNGSAKVSSGQRSLGWILFHEPWSRARRTLAW